jgi:serine protease Do
MDHPTPRSGARRSARGLAPRPVASSRVSASVLRWLPLVLLALLARLPAQSGEELDRPIGLLQGMEAEPGERDLRETPIVRAVRRAKDSVVNVYLTRVVPPEYGGQVVEGQGSGVILDQRGLVITNWHVTLAAEIGRDGLVCALNDGSTYPARLLASSAEHDLALLQMELPDGVRVQPITLGDSDTLMIGETVIAIGNPQGRSNSVTAGVLSAIDREIRVRTPDGAPRAYTGLLQTDAAINQGNSGGALLDITGKLIGINNAMQRDVENIGFAIPINTVRRVFDEVLLESENVQNAWLGLTVDFASAQGGALEPRIEDVAGPAERAGLRTGDRVRRIGSEPLTDRVSYLRALASVSPGQPVDVEYERDGERGRAEITPLSRAQFEVWRRIGIHLDEITPESNEQLVRTVSLAWARAAGRRAYMLDSVLRVDHLEPDGPAAEIGVKPGDILLAVQGFDRFGRARPVIPATVEQLADRLRGFAGRNLPIVILRGESELDGKVFVRKL